MKICKKCNKNKEEKDFYKSNNTNDGLRGSCKECYKSPKREYKQIKDKKCIKCKDTKDIKYFNKNKLSLDNYGSYCKICEKEKLKNYNINKYGITTLEHKEMLLSQDYSCGICGKKQDYKSLHIDHSHKTNKVRGLLCHKCNSGLGMFDDNIALLLLAATYLEQNN